jgi:hypothetical protein
MSPAWLTMTSRIGRNSEGSVVASAEPFRALRTLCAYEEKHLVSLISRGILHVHSIERRQLGPMKGLA